MSKRKITTMCALFIVLSIIFILIGGCSRQDSSTTGKSAHSDEKIPASDNSNTGSSDTNTDSETSDSVAESTGFPLFDKPVTLKWWRPYSDIARQYVKDPNDNIVYQEMEKMTNIHFEFIVPPTGQEAEQFNLMIAANDLPDLISCANLYKGGGDKAIEDGVYIKLNDLIEQYAPNYKKLRDSNIDVARQTVSDSGNIYAFIACNDFEDTTWWGPLIKQQWLDELGLSMPETIDDWYNVLKAFKEEKGAIAPLVNIGTVGYDAQGGVFVGAYGIWPGYYIKEDGSIANGLLEPEFKEYLATMNKWYNEGLIDKDFPTRKGDAVRNMITTDKSGAVIESPDTIGSLCDPLNIEISGAPYPVLEKGDELKFRMKQWNIYSDSATAITTACKHAEEAVKWLDYGYGEEGRMLFNFGIKGVTYDIDQDGNPYYLDYVINNPDGIPLNAGIFIFRLHNDTPSYRYGSLSNPIPMLRKKSQEIRKMWTEQSPAEFNLPPITFTAEEGSKRASIASNLDPYRDEMIIKFITGVEPLTKFDEYVAECKRLGADEDLKIVEDAYRRYISRTEK